MLALLSAALPPQGRILPNPGWLSPDLHLLLLSSIQPRYRCFLPFPPFELPPPPVPPPSISAFTQIVPDTVIFYDFLKFPPTAATVSSSLLLGICSLPDTIFRKAVVREGIG